MSPDESKEKLPVVVRAEGASRRRSGISSACVISRFFRFWSYPVFRDQKANRNGDDKGDGKELCDLLVVFGNDVLIFSDKSCAFPNSGNIQVSTGPALVSAGL